jgi:hypothetical protein
MAHTPTTEAKMRRALQAMRREARGFREESAKMGQALNTDREIWREREGDAYADSIHVTREGGIGINCGGHVFVLPVREWHRLAYVAALASREG